jgi:hypothetical protein
VLTKEGAEKLRAKAEAEKEAAIAKGISMGQERKEQALKKTQKEAEKAESGHQRAVTRDTRAEMARMAKINKRLHSCLFELFP